MRQLSSIRSIAALAVAATLVSSETQAQSTNTTLFKDVRVFDGTRTLEAQQVLIENGRITKVARAVTAPAGATVVDGRGKTLLPGFIDAHTHSYSDAAKSAIYFGVTTELDMFSVGSVAADARAEQAAGKATGRADLYSAGILVTAPKGHGTEYGIEIPTITSPDSAQSFVDARIAEGSDFIKIVLDDGHAYARPMATLGAATLRAVIVAAHKRDKLAVVHIGDLAGARTAIDAGADALVHLFVDKNPDADFGRFVGVARPGGRRAFVIPTLTVLMSVTGVGGGATLVGDARLALYISRTDSAVLIQGFPRRTNQPPVSYAAAESTVRQLKVAGVPILAGTDAGNPGTAHGVALHRELELLVKAGLTPSEALVAATSAPAKAFRLTDRGRIVEGMRADLVLVTGDPTTDITATRAIDGIWKEGVRINREAFAKTIADARKAASDAPAGSELGLVSDFESGTPKASFGAGWMPSNDAMASGKSTADMNVVDGGANGSAKALAASGTIDGAIPYAWGGVMFSPGTAVMAPANLSSKKSVSFWAKGDGQTYRVMIFAQSKGFVPLTQSFVAGPEWKEYVLPFSAFGGIDGRDMMSLIFAAGPRPGPYAFQIDDVRFR